MLVIGCPVEPLQHLKRGYPAQVDPVAVALAGPRIGLSRSIMPLALRPAEGETVNTRAS
jgi:hypothetical protein